MLDRRSDSIVCLAYKEYLVRDLSLSGRVCGLLFDIVTCVSLICSFLNFCLNVLLLFNGEIKTSIREKRTSKFIGFSIRLMSGSNE